MTPLLGGALVALAMIAFLYEVSQAAQGKPTISAQVWAFEHKWPPILFLAGLLAGHLFTC